MPFYVGTCLLRRLGKLFFSIAAVAQWIEYWPPKPRVVGSIPASRTKSMIDVSRSRLMLQSCGFLLALTPLFISPARRKSL